MTEWLKYLKYFLLTLFIYLFFAGRFIFYYPITKTNYFVLLADAFLHGQTNLRIIPAKGLDDLSIFNGKIYLYWPPLPSILLMPLVYFFGTNISDVLFLAIFASFSPFLMFLILLELKKNKFLIIDIKKALLLSLFFAFGTSYFSISILGTVWFTSQVIQIFILNLALLFFIRFNRTNKNFDFLVGSTTFALVIWSRIIPVLSFPLFFYFLINKKKIYLSIFVLILLISIFLFGFYNKVRFNSFFETGFNYQIRNKHFENDFQKFGSFSIYYIPRNFFQTIIKPLPLMNNFPYIRPDPEGNGIFFTSPLLWTLFIFFFKRIKIRKKVKLFLKILLLSIFLTIISILSGIGTGWIQFGNRYLLDIMPLLIILIAIITPYVPKLLFTTLTFVSIMINTLGALWLLFISPFIYF